MERSRLPPFKAYAPLRKPQSGQQSAAGVSMGRNVSVSEEPAPTDRVEAGGVFHRYVEVLSDAVRTGARLQSPAVVGALNGEVGRRHRSGVGLTLRRQQGAFFTGRDLAHRLVSLAPELTVSGGPIADPACGAGDLLLAAARLLPTERGFRATLAAWGSRLNARDLDPVYSRLCRLRLAMLASDRVGESEPLTDENLRDLLPGVRTGDGASFRFERSGGILLLNPPFGAVTADELWGRGRVARAGVFAARLFAGQPEQTTALAILPDVLRAGSNYRRWREHVNTLGTVRQVAAVGQFDPWTDIDVFLLALRIGGAPSNPDWWAVPDVKEGTVTVGDTFEVRVGPVVPHRDPDDGPLRPFLRARDLPTQGEYRPGAVSRRHSGRTFTPPFVVVRRTSRPEAGLQRLTVALVRGRSKVFVENHLLVCRPLDGRLESCVRLEKVLAARRTTEWLDQRLRCRHLTVGAVREIPLWA